MPTKKQTNFRCRRRRWWYCLGVWTLASSGVHGLGLPSRERVTTVAWWYSNKPWSLPTRRHHETPRPHSRTGSVESTRMMIRGHSFTQLRSHVNDSLSHSVSPSKMLKAVLLIAGTTVGGGFLALPSSVVLPLGGFVPSAISLAVVWLYLLIHSLVLTHCLIQFNKQQGTTLPSSPDFKGDTHNATDQRHRDMIGIPRAAQQALGPKGATIATLWLVLLTQATLVSQLSRAGILLADSHSLLQTQTPLARYRVGCALASTLGAVVSFHGRMNTDERKDEPCTIPSLSSSSSQSPPSSSDPSLAATVNAVLTSVFLISVMLLFQAGRSQATWSRCWSVSVTTNLESIARAAPVMLQLLVYGEILPNVCHMLGYNGRAIRRCVALGSFIPLVLLTGWAALGVSLLPPPTATAEMGDPVKILLRGKNSVSTCLLVLSLSAISTTILGSFLALQSVYDDVTTLRKQKHGATSTESKWHCPWTSMVCIVAPPTLIAAISPSLFLRAIDFAGSYPILLLYGVLPTLMSFRLADSARTKAHIFGLTVLSGTIVVTKFASDVGGIVSWFASRFRF